MSVLKTDAQRSPVFVCRKSVFYGNSQVELGVDEGSTSERLGEFKRQSAKIAESDRGMVLWNASRA